MNTVNPERFHLTLHARGRPAMQGWWADRATADAKFTQWIGERGNVDGSRVAHERGLFADARSEHRHSTGHTRTGK